MWTEGAMKRILWIASGGRGLPVEGSMVSIVCLVGCIDLIEELDIICR